MRIFWIMFFVMQLHAVDIQQLVRSMSLDQKIGQLFMVAAIDDIEHNQTFIQQTPYNVHPDYIKKLIVDYHIGGVIFLGSAKKKSLLKQVEQFQQLSNVPLLMGLDAEWGIAMRVKDGRCFAKNAVLGKLSDNEVCNVAQNIGQDCKELGIHINFAPVVDINTNPKNPIIGARAFGDNKELVAQKGIAYMKGLHNVGVLSCAKHFPGHGDTDVDSHVQLPILRHSKKRLYEIELWPFKELIKVQVSAIMMGHLSVPALDNVNIPASFSKNIIQGLLRNKLKFNGLIVTDGLGMQAITNHHEPGELELYALLAGNDILLCPMNVPKACKKIKYALDNGYISEQEIDEHVERILRAKKKLA